MHRLASAFALIALTGFGFAEATGQSFDVKYQHAPSTAALFGTSAKTPTPFGHLFGYLDLEGTKADLDTFYGEMRAFVVATDALGGHVGGVIETNISSNRKDILRLGVAFEHRDETGYRFFKFHPVAVGREASQISALVVQNLSPHLGISIMADYNLPHFYVEAQAYYSLGNAKLFFEERWLERNQSNTHYLGVQYSF